MSILFFVNYVALILLVFFSKVGFQRAGIALVSIIWAAFSASSIVEGTDITAYQNAFEKMKSGAFYAWNHDYIFWLIMYAFSSIGVTFKFFYFFIVFFVNFFVLRAAKEYLLFDRKFYAFISIYMVSTSFVFFQSNILRQGLAFALLLPVVLGVSKVRLYHFLTLGVHFSSFILLFLRNYKFVFVLSFSMVVLFFFYSSYSDVFWLAKKAERLMDKSYPVYYLFLFFFSFVFLVVLRGKFDRWLVSLSVFSLSLVLMPYVGYRVSFYFQPIIILLALERLHVGRGALCLIVVLSAAIGVFVYSNDSIIKLSGFHL